MKLNAVDGGSKKNGSNEQSAEAVRTDLFGSWADRAWSLPTTAGTSRAADHAFQACRTLLLANQTATEALYDTARRQQDLTFKLVRTALEACSPGSNGSGAQEPTASWKTMMASYAEAYNAGLDVAHVMTGATFRALLRTAAMVANDRADGSGAS
ncbi:hypothetical protein ACFQX4_26355 [Roseomonas sp. GCM10028921]